MASWPDGSSGPLTIYFGPDMQHKHHESVAVPVMPVEEHEEIVRKLRAERNHWCDVADSAVSDLLDSTGGQHVSSRKVGDN